MIEAQITHLRECACTGSDCRLYSTGHVSGASGARLANDELASRDHVGASYLCSSPMVGDEALADHHMDALCRCIAIGPICEVVESNEIGARHRSETAFRLGGI